MLKQASLVVIPALLQLRFDNLPPQGIFAAEVGPPLDAVHLKALGSLVLHEYTHAYRWMSADLLCLLLHRSWVKCQERLQQKEEL